MGTAGVTTRDRVRISAIFVVFEGGMPLIGFAIGAPLSRAVGTVADYLAIALLLALGGWMILSREDDERASRLLTARGLAMVGLGLSISLDELAIGFSIGLVRLPVATVIVAIALQALIASQLGLTLGGRIRERVREGVERLAGLVLVGLGLFLLLERLVGR
ncbi:MAG: manganese efflux pump MntP family protein [Candidatus Dormibacteraceae bacterium]